MVRLRLLGSTRLTAADGRDIDAVLSQPKRLAVLSYLAVSDGFQRRDKLLAMFWPDLDASRSREALNQCVHFLRRALGGGADSAIVSRGGAELGIANSFLWCDATAFRAAVDSGRFEEAVDLYRGDLLAGFYVSGSPGFEEWLDTERSRLRSAASRAATEVADANERARDHGTALEFARRAIELAGLDEHAMRGLLGRLNRLGDRAGALEAYRIFANRLREELEAEPSGETVLLIERIRQRTQVHRTDPFLASRANLSERELTLREAGASTETTPDGNVTARAPLTQARASGLSNSEDLGPPTVGVPHRDVGVDGSNESVPVRLRSPRFSRAGWVGVALSTTLMLVVALTLTRLAAPSPTPLWFRFAPPADVNLSPLGFSYALSRDGTTLAFVAGHDRNVVTVRLDDPTPIRFPRAIRASDLHWSPDGRMLAYRAYGDSGGLMVLRTDKDAASAQPRLIQSMDGSSWITWTSSAHLVYAWKNALWRVEHPGERPQKIAEMDSTLDSQWRQPVVLSDGKTIAFRVTPRGAKPLGADRLGLISISGGTRTLLDFAAEGAIGDLDGTLIFSRHGYALGQGQIVGVRFDLRRRVALGSPVLLVDSVLTETGAGALATLSSDGTLAYLKKTPDPAMQIINGQGGVLAEVRGLFFQPRWSPDGKRIVMYTGDRNTLAVYDVASGTLTHFPEAQGSFPSWTSDSRRIVFTSTTEHSGGQPMWMPVDRSEPPSSITGIRDFHASTRESLLSPDGKWLVVRIQSLATDTVGTLRAVAIRLGTSDRVPVVTETSNPQLLALSPKGNLIAYHERVGNRPPDVFVRPFPAGSGRVKVSVEGAIAPRWSADGRRIFYRTWPEGGFRVVSLDGRSPLPHVLRTDTLFAGRRFVASIGSFDVHPSGSRFLITQDVGARESLELIANFATLVNQKMGRR